METITTNLIIQSLKERVREKIPISPNDWLDAGIKLNTLLGDEAEELFKLQQKVAQLKVEYLEKGTSVSEAKTRVEASDDYRRYCLQKAKITRIEEHIRLAKLMARTSQGEYSGGNL